MTSRPARRTLAATAALAAATGCASINVDSASQSALEAARALSGAEAVRIDSDADRERVAAGVARLLDRPVAAADAVRIALAHSPSFQALLQDGAAAMAASVQSGRPANPVFSFERLARGDDLDLGRLLSAQLLDVLTWPRRSRAADLRLAQDQIRLTGEIVDRAADARRAWVDAVAAEQSLRYARDVLTAAEVGAELARRMHGVGNFSRRQQAREQAFYAEAAVQAARAEQAQLAAREALVRLLGLDRAQAARLRLPDRLPDLPASPRPPAAITEQGLAQRLDVQAAQRALEHGARQAGLTRVRSVLSRLELGIARNSETGEPAQRGYEIEVPLPLFDAGDAMRAEARASYLAQVHRVRQTIIDAQSQVHQAYAAYRSAYDIARHYREEILPLRRGMAEENVLRYNGMLIGVFELLADAREQAATVLQAIEAQRGFWLADAALEATLIGRAAPVAAAAASPRSAAAAPAH